MKIPGPDHPIAITPTGKRVRVTSGDTVIADSSRALTLKEAAYPPVQYIPRADVDMTLLQRSEHATHCPYKGDASYFGLTTDRGTVDDAVWSYEAPYPAMRDIAHFLAFYSNKVTVEIVS